MLSSRFSFYNDVLFFIFFNIRCLLARPPPTPPMPPACGATIYCFILQIATMWFRHRRSLLNVVQYTTFSGSTSFSSSYAFYLELSVTSSWSHLILKDAIIEARSSIPRRCCRDIDDLLTYVIASFNFNCTPSPPHRLAASIDTRHLSTLSPCTTSISASTSRREG